MHAVRLQANTEHKGKLKGINNAKSGENIIPHHGSKLAQAFGGHGVAGGQAGAGGSDNGRGSHSNSPQGGAAVVPLYAGAAHGRRNNHHSAGSSIHLSIVSSTLTTILMAYLLIVNPFK